ncbi:hypothetical protein EDC01DRAFT_638376 [Geopyxis carbonaria]|nr:hypothetical protein EDC01DRAFT_638376 [Geopyxis carbonaria]
MRTPKDPLGLRSTLCNIGFDEFCQQPESPAESPAQPPDPSPPAEKGPSVSKKSWEDAKPEVVRSTLRAIGFDIVSGRPEPRRKDPRIARPSDRELPRSNSIDRTLCAVGFDSFCEVPPVSTTPNPSERDTSITATTQDTAPMPRLFIPNDEQFILYDAINFPLDSETQVELHLDHEQDIQLQAQSNALYKLLKATNKVLTPEIMRERIKSVEQAAHELAVDLAKEARAMRVADTMERLGRRRLGIPEPEGGRMKPESMFDKLLGKKRCPLPPPDALPRKGCLMRPRNRGRNMKLRWAYNVKLVDGPRPTWDSTIKDMKTSNPELLKDTWQMEEVRRRLVLYIQREYEEDFASWQQRDPFEVYSENAEDQEDDDEDEDCGNISV